MSIKKCKIKIPFYVILLLLIFIFRNTILEKMGNFLVVNQNFEHIETAFVLSGGAFDRGNHAANLINTKKIDKVICTGANQPPDFKALHLDMLESELTRKNIISQIQDSSIVKLLKVGTSTIEESEIILDYCIQNKLSECVLISSSFHTRRILNVFQKKFAKKNIRIYISGANASSYNEKQWWHSENGLTALNNEYIKLVYYLIKY